MHPRLFVAHSFPPWHGSHASHPFLLRPVAAQGLQSCMPRRAHCFLWPLLLTAFAWPAQPSTSTWRPQSLNLLSLVSFWGSFLGPQGVSSVALVVKNPPANAGDFCKRCRFDLSVSRIPWRRAWQPTPVFLPGESPWTEEPDGLQSMGSQRVRQERSDQVCAVPVKPHDSRPAVLNLLVTRGRIHGRRFFYGRGRGRGMVSEWFKCITFIVHFLLQLHPLHLRSSGIRSRSLGTTVLKLHCGIHSFKLTSASRQKSSLGIHNKYTFPSSGKVEWFLPPAMNIH